MFFQTKDNCCYLSNVITVAVKLFCMENKKYCGWVYLATYRQFQLLIRNKNVSNFYRIGLGRYSQQPIRYVFDTDLADTIRIRCDTHVHALRFQN